MPSFHAPEKKKNHGKMAARDAIRPADYPHALEKSPLLLILAWTYALGVKDGTRATRAYKQAQAGFRLLYGTKIVKCMICFSTLSLTDSEISSVLVLGRHN